MKTLIGALALVTSMAASAQSFVLQSNGVLLSIDSAAKIYDLNQFVAPTSLLAKGKNWLLDKNQLVITVDAKGFVYKKTGMKGPKKLKASGGSWFIADNGDMNIVTLDGFFYTYDKDDLFKKGTVEKAGGNFLIVKRDNALSLVTIDTAKGLSYTATPATLTSLGLNLATVNQIGGNYFVDGAGVIYTVDKNGLIGKKTGMGNFANLKVRGGNYLVDSFGGVRVVLDNGYLLLPNLPKAMGAVSKSGTTHLWDAEGEFFTVAESVADAEVTSSNTAVFTAVLNKLILQPTEQPDPRTIAP